MALMHRLSRKEKRVLMTACWDAALHHHYPVFNYSISEREAEKHWFLMSAKQDPDHEQHFHKIDT